jgi:hypothetical protein
VASTFSEASLASSATDISKASGYSTTQIATATQELATIFLEDTLLIPLYRLALENPAIGAEKLQKKLRRLLKAYAKHLDREAADHLEYIAARLVSIKARWLAELIVRKFQITGHNHELLDIDQDESSDDEAVRRQVRDDNFEDLKTFREFLVRGGAFQTLREHVHAFVLPKPSKIVRTWNALPLSNDWKRRDETGLLVREGGALIWQMWLKDVAVIIDAYLRKPVSLPLATTLLCLVDAVFLATDGFFTAMGQLEPALKEGSVRLRWKCVCTA